MLGLILITGLFSCKKETKRCGDVIGVSQFCAYGICFPYYSLTIRFNDGSIKKLEDIFNTPNPFPNGKYCE